MFFKVFGNAAFRAYGALDGPLEPILARLRVVVAPEGPKMDPTPPQDGPRTTRDKPKTSQDEPKMAPQGLGMFVLSFVPSLSALVWNLAIYIL